MIKLIESKLRPPDLSPSLIKRERLTERLRINLNLSASFMCAGPGWGKTTAAAEFLATTDRRAVWYDLDSSDADMALFFHYLVRAVAQVAPDFGRSTLDMLWSGGRSRPDQLADLFLYELSEAVEQEMIIVLDNLHHVFTAEWSGHVLYRILQLLPENIHLMMLARVAPSFTFSRMRSKQSMDQLDDRALAFTRGEAIQLMSGVLDNTERVDRLLNWTQGWVAGLQIIRQALEADEDLRDQEIEKIITQSETAVFDYFAEKVYRAEPPAMRAILVRSALPQRVTPDIMSEALGLEVISEQLQSIVRENIFLSRVAGEPDIFVYHPLFRDFLCKQLEEETTDQERAHMHRLLADYYNRRESWAHALHHFFEAGDETSAARTLLAAQTYLLANGLTLTVNKYFPRFRDDTLKAHPQLYNLMGDMHVIEGDTASAEAMFRAALATARDAGDQATEAAALAGLAHTAARDHNFADAITHAEEAAACAPAGDTSVQALTFAARIKNVIGAVRSFEGRYIEANDLMEEALRLAHEAGDVRLVRTISHNLALPAYMEGDFHAALRYFARSPISDANDVARDNDQQLGAVLSRYPALHPDSITLYLNRSAIYTAQGKLELAERDLDSAAELASVFNLRGFLPRIHEGRGNIARERRQFDEADQLYNEAFNEYRSVDADPLKADLYYERAALEMRRGNLNQALELINLMVTDREESQREIEAALARQMRGRILVQRNDARAIFEADASEPLLRRLQCNYYLAIGCYLRARALAGRDADAGRRAFEEFLSLAERFDYSYFVACEESFYHALSDMCRLYSATSDWLSFALAQKGRGRVTVDD
jgi:ATP/maltotriose-dependent transcriptional regulator MalT